MPPRHTPRTLAQWPWVVVRVDCVLCRRSGCYRLARLAAKYGPEQSIDGLLRDLAHDCPWYNERPRKYEPRCGARFPDLERNVPPADHPEAPIYRQRQPGREDLPQPPRAARPASASFAGPTLATWPHAGMLLTCETCGRREVLVVAELRALLGPDMLVGYACAHLTADCPRRKAASIYEQCGALLKRLGAD